MRKREREGQWHCFCVPCFPLVQCSALENNLPPTGLTWCMEELAFFDTNLTSRCPSGEMCTRRQLLP